MKIKIQITVESDKGQPEVVQEVAYLDRGILRPETTRADAGRSAIDSRWDISGEITGRIRGFN
jgi:hypothetical protein